MKAIVNVRGRVVIRRLTNRRMYRLRVNFRFGGPYVSSIRRRLPVLSNRSLLR